MMFTEEAAKNNYMLETIKQHLGTVQCQGCDAKFDAVRDGGLGLALSTMLLPESDQDGQIIRVDIGCGICSHTGFRLFSRGLLDSYKGDFKNG